MLKGTSWKLMSRPNLKTIKQGFRSDHRASPNHYKCMPMLPVRNVAHLVLRDNKADYRGLAAFAGEAQLY